MSDSSDSRPASSHASSQPGGGWTPPSVEHLQALLPQYEIVSMLGHGGMGAVYKGRQKSLDRVVAIKILPPGLENSDAKFVERFQNEARTMAKLIHPGIVAVFDFGETVEGQLYFVMEYVDGTDVAKMIQSSGKLPQDYALAITAHVCDALGYAHANGVVHRDIKPANILINMQGQIKVADFGLAKMDDPAQTSGLTKTGYAMGTPDYVSPEALIMGSSIDGRADLYAIGVMLYQMLTGEIPRGLFQMPNVRTHGETDPRFDAIISKAMQTDREARYQTASELRQALDVILTTPHIKQDASKVIAAVPEQVVQCVPDQRSAAQKPVARGPKAPQPPAAKPSPPKKGSSGMIWVGGSIAAVLAIVGFVFLSGGKKSENVPVATTAAAAPKPAPTVSPSSEGWIDGLAEWLAVPGNATKTTLQKEADGWRYKGPLAIGLGAKLSPQYRLANVAVRLTSKGGGGAIGLRDQGGPGNNYVAVQSYPNFVEIRRCQNKEHTTIAKFKLPPGFKQGDSYVLEFRAEGEVLTLIVNGQTLGSVKDSTYASGKFHVSPLYALIQKLEYRDLGGSSSGTAAGSQSPSSGWNSLPDLPKTLTSTNAVHASQNGPADFALKATVTGAAAGWSLFLRGSGTGYPNRYGASWKLRNGRHTLALLRWQEGQSDATPLAEQELPAGFDPAARHTMEFSAQGSTLAVGMDGKELIRVDDKALPAGNNHYFSGPPGAVLEKMEFRSWNGATADIGWTDGLAEWWQTQANTGNLVREGNAARVAGTKAILLKQELPAADVAVRMRIRRFNDVCGINLRQEKFNEVPHKYITNFSPNGSAELSLMAGAETVAVLARGRAIPGFDPAVPHVLEFSARGQELRVLVDGQEVASVRDARRVTGIFYITAMPGCVIEMLEYQELTPP